MTNEEHGRRTSHMVKEWFVVWMKLLAKVSAVLSVMFVGVHVVFAPMFVGVYVEYGILPLEAWTADSPSIIWTIALVPWWAIIASAIVSAHIVTERDQSE